MGKRFRLIPLVAILVALIGSSLPVFAQPPVSHHPPSCRQACERQYRHCENSCIDRYGRPHKKCFHGCRKHEKRCIKSCQRHGHYR
ncbi:MAG TPA: hypothetical protein VGJ94_16830 [Syntrophorhabdaceae bacterium]